MVAPGMKIEIGEFLILSWLRHVHGCVVTQMNWSPSPAWTVARERELRRPSKRFADSRMTQSADPASGRSTSDHSSATPGSTCWGSAWIATRRHRRDRRRSAINDTELPHGNAEETIVRLIQRMTRAGFALAAYLNPRQASVVFATPWLREGRATGGAAPPHSSRRALPNSATRRSPVCASGSSPMPTSPTRSCSRCCSTSMRSRTRVGRPGNHSRRRLLAVPAMAPPGAERSPAHGHDQRGRPHRRACPQDHGPAGASGG